MSWKRIGKWQAAFAVAVATLILSMPWVVIGDGQSSWQAQGRQAIATAEKLNGTQRDHAKSVILFIGDGMGVSTVTAARILGGQKRGESGEENWLSFEKFPHVALVKTYSVNQQTSDSAPTMTAMVTGSKTKDGILSVDEHVVRGDHTTVKGNELTTILEQAEKRGLSTGVVSTARLTHATPAACYAHSPERDWEADSNLTPAAVEAGFKDIAAQLIDFPVGNGLEVALGGGRSYFRPMAKADPEDTGEVGLRADGRDLTEEWASRDRSRYVWNEEQFDAVDPKQTSLNSTRQGRVSIREHGVPRDVLCGHAGIAQMTRSQLALIHRARSSEAACAAQETAAVQ